MIEGGWEFVWAAYAVTAGAVVALTALVVSRLMHWSRKARALDENMHKAAP